MSTAFWIFVVMIVLAGIFVFRIFKPVEGYSPAAYICLSIACLATAGYSGNRALENYRHIKPFSSEYASYLATYDSACGGSANAFPDEGVIPGKINFLRFNESGELLHTDLEFSQEIGSNSPLLANSPAEMKTLIITYRDYSVPSGVKYTDGKECKLETLMLFFIDPKTKSCRQKDFIADPKSCAYVKDKGDEDKAYVHVDEVVEWLVPKVVLE